jgi:hypothetical protein
MYGEEHVRGGADTSWSLFVTNEREMSMTETKLLIQVHKTILVLISVFGSMFFVLITIGTVLS